MQIGQQTRKMFGLCYRTVLGNDTDGNDHGYKLHIVYGCMASPSSKEYDSISDSPSPAALSWELTTTPVEVTGFKPTAQLVIDSTKATAAKLTALETILYGKNPTTAEANDGSEPRLPLPDEIKTLMDAA